VADFAGWTPRLRTNEGEEVTKPASPRELTLVNQCKKWRSLPKSGGLFDQPAGLMGKLSFLDNVAEACTIYKNREPGKEDKLPDWVREMVRYIQKVRKNGGLTP